MDGVSMICLCSRSLGAIRSKVFFSDRDRILSTCHVALVEDTNIIITKTTNNRMQKTTVMEKDHITILPLVSKDILRVDTRSLHLVKELTDLFQITHGLAINDQILDSGRMYLEMDFTSDRVLPELFIDVSI